MTLSHLRERPSGWEDGRTKEREPAGWQTPLVKVRKLCGLRLLRRCGLSFRYGFRWRLVGEPRFLLGGELLLHLEGDGIGVHLVCLGCGLEYLSAVGLRTCGEQNHDLDREAIEYALICLANEGRAQLADGLPLLGADASAPCDHDQPA